MLQLSELFSKAKFIGIENRSAQSLFQASELWLSFRRYAMVAVIL